MYPSIEPRRKNARGLLTFCAAGLAMALALSTLALTIPSTALAAGPTAPRNVHAVGGNGQMTVSWDPPTSDGGSPIASYRAISTPDLKTCYAYPPATSCTIIGLTNGTT